MSKHLFAPVKGQYVRISYNDITYVEANGDYVNIYINNGSRITVYGSMNRAGDWLPVDIFQRVHRSYFVNMEYVKIIDKSGNGTSNHSLYLSNPSSTLIPLGDHYKKDFYSRIEVLGGKS